MRIGYHTIRWGYGRVFRSFQQILSEISTAGFEGFGTHIIDVLPFLNNGNRFIEVLEKAKMKLASIYTTVDSQKLLSMLIPQSLQNRRYSKLAKFADLVDCRRFIVAASAVRKKNYGRKDYLMLAGKLNKIGRIFNEYNVELSFHPHIGTIVENAQQIDKLLELVDPNFVHLTLDTGHLVAVGVDLVGFIKTYGEKINHVELKDYKENKWTEFGEGVIDFSIILKNLDSVGYDGWLVIEDEVNCSVPMQGLTNRTPNESAKRSRKKLVQLLEQIRDAD